MLPGFVITGSAKVENDIFVAVVEHLPLHYQQCPMSSFAFIVTLIFVFARLVPSCYHAIVTFINYLTTTPSSAKWATNHCWQDSDGNYRFFCTLVYNRRWYRVIIVDESQNPPDLDPFIRSKRIQGLLNGKEDQIQYRRTATKLRVRIDEGQLCWVHVEEHPAEIIDHPSLSAVDNVKCPLVKESEVRLESKLAAWFFRVSSSFQGRAGYYSMKEIRTPDDVDDFLCQLDDLARVQKHPNIVELQGIVTDEIGEKVKGFLFTDAAGGLVDDLIAEDKGLLGSDGARSLRLGGPLPDSRGSKLYIKYESQLTAALVHMHGLGVIQGDLSPTSIIVDGSGDLRIAPAPKCCREGWGPPEFWHAIEMGMTTRGLIDGYSDTWQCARILSLLALGKSEKDGIEAILRRIRKLRTLKREVTISQHGF